MTIQRLCEVVGKGICVMIINVACVSCPQQDNGESSGYVCGQWTSLCVNKQCMVKHLFNVLAQWKVPLNKYFMGRSLAFQFNGIIVTSLM